MERKSFKCSVRLACETEVARRRVCTKVTRVVGSRGRWARGDGDSVRGRDWSIAYNVTPRMYQSARGLVRFRTFGMVHVVVVVRSFVRSFVRASSCVVTASSSSSVREGVFFCVSALRTARACANASGMAR